MTFSKVHNDFYSDAVGFLRPFSFWSWVVVKTCVVIFIFLVAWLIHFSFIIDCHSFVRFQSFFVRKANGKLLSWRSTRSCWSACQASRKFPLQWTTKDIWWVSFIVLSREPIHLRAITLVVSAHALKVAHDDVCSYSSFVVSVFVFLLSKSVRRRFFPLKY